MKITVTMELTQENLSKLRALLPDTEIPGQLSMFDAPSEKPVEPDKPAEEDKPTGEEKPITKTDIRAVALKLSKAGKPHGRLSGAYERAGERQWLSMLCCLPAALIAGLSVRPALSLNCSFRRAQASTPRKAPPLMSFVS